MNVEVCGLLIGDGDVVHSVCDAPNVAADIRCTFEIDPAALLAAHRAARLGGSAVIGCYHSHPTGPAWPSPRDAAAAGPGDFLWLILGAGEHRMFRAVEGGRIHGRFEPEDLMVTSLATASSRGQKAAPPPIRGPRP